MIDVIKQRLDSQAVRYVLSGMLSFAVENITFIICYYVFSLNPEASNIISIGIALCVNFFTSKFFVFRNVTSAKQTRVQAITYFVLVGINLVISTILVSALIKSGLHGYIAKPLVTLAIISWTYFIYKKVIFKADQSLVQ